MNKYYVIGDVHGELDKLQEILKYWNSDSEQLVLLGDLVDRGPDSYGVIKLAMELKEKYGAKINKGNHEDMFLSWLEMPSSEMDLYYPQGGKNTINSFFQQNITSTLHPIYIAQKLKEQFSDELSFIKNLPLYTESENHVFVHAGVNLSIDDWRESREADFLWIREKFIYSSNKSNKIFIFGHTPTKYLNNDKSDNIYIPHCRTKIALDGGAVFGGSLHAVIVDEDKDGDRAYITHSIDKDKVHVQGSIKL